MGGFFILRDWRGSAWPAAVSAKFAFWPEDHSVYYPCYETGGQFWSAGMDMYSPRVCPVDFRYGPAAAMVLAAFAALPTWLGGLLWIWMNLGVFFASLWSLMRRVLPGQWTPQRQGVSGAGAPRGRGASGPVRATCSFSR